MSEDEGDRKSHLRLAVENDRQTVEREWARHGIGSPLRNLAANIIRVVRGAGKSYEIGEQCADVLKAFKAYRESVGHWPTSFEIDEALSVFTGGPDDTYDEFWSWRCAQEEIMRGGLQVAASRLVGQRTQENRGQTEMMDGVRALDRIREDRRARAAEEEKARRQALRAASIKAKSGIKVKRSKATTETDPDISL